MSVHRVNNIDTNIQNYSLAELMAIAELQELEPKEIVLKTNSYINKFKDSDPILSAFFIELQSQLLRYAQGLTPPEHPINEYNEYIEGYDNQEGDNNNDVIGYNNNNGNLNRNEYKYNVNSDDADDYDNDDNIILINPISITGGKKRKYKRRHRSKKGKTIKKSLRKKTVKRKRK